MEQVITTVAVKERKARSEVGGITRARNLRLNDVVTIVDTNFRFKVVFKSFFETIVVPLDLVTNSKPRHVHRMKIMPFTMVILLERE